MLSPSALSLVPKTIIHPKRDMGAEQCQAAKSPPSTIISSHLCKPSSACTHIPAHTHTAVVNATSPGGENPK